VSTVSQSQEKPLAYLKTWLKEQYRTGKCTESITWRVPGDLYASEGVKMGDLLYWDAETQELHLGVWQEL